MRSWLKRGSDTSDSNESPLTLHGLSRPSGLRVVAAAITALLVAVGSIVTGQPQGASAAEEIASVPHEVSPPDPGTDPTQPAGVTGVNRGQPSTPNNGGTGGTSGSGDPGDVGDPGDTSGTGDPGGSDTGPPPGAPSVTIGLNFRGSQFFDDSNFIPPDTMGAVGLDHVVELINGRLDVYDKVTGSQVSTMSLHAFWTGAVGLPAPPLNECGGTMCSLSGTDCTTTSCPINYFIGPRIVFDLASGRWFATSIDRFGGNNVYLARSDTSDPTGGWAGVMFPADSIGATEFHDYATLAVDADGVYICTDDFAVGGPPFESRSSFKGAASEVAGDGESCYSIPKADLLLAIPSVANMTRFESSPPGLPSSDGSLQPALDFGPSDGRTALLGVSGGVLVRGDIFGAGGPGATLGSVALVTGDPGHAEPPAARQPHPFDPTVTIENVAPRFVSSVVEQGDSLWAVHAVMGGGTNSALRWYEIDEPTNTVLQTGLIERVDEDFHEPSIAVNELGQVVIGYTASGPNLAPSSVASVGQTVDGVTTFAEPMILAMGAGHYYQDGRHNNCVTSPFPTRNRWGDYSATVVDPVDPQKFWTFQQIVAVSADGDVGPCPRLRGGRWSIQVTELSFEPGPTKVDGHRLLTLQLIDALHAIVGAIDAGARDVDDPEDAIDELEDAIDDLEDSLEEELWLVGANGELDPDRLDCEEGDEVFEENEDAVDEIFDAIEDGEIDNPMLIDELLELVGILVAGDRNLAVVAITDAEAHPNPDEEELEEAYEELEDGDEHVQDAAEESDLDDKDDELEDAVDDYGDAWEEAVEAVDCSYPPPNPDTTGSRPVGPGPMTFDDELRAPGRAIATLEVILRVIDEGGQGVADPEEAIGEIRDAIADLDSSLAPELWAITTAGELDPRHLDPDEGDEVFEEAAHAVDEVVHAIVDGKIQDPLLLLDLFAVAESLVDASARFAREAILDAIGSPHADSSDVARALTLMKDGDEAAYDASKEADVARFGDLVEAAIDAYGDAWEKAQEALR